MKDGDVNKTATIAGRSLAQFCPTTHHYKCSDGRWLLVSVPNSDAMLSTLLGVTLPVTYTAPRAEVFLADEHAVVLDADGDPANGMTPLAVFDGCSSHGDALAQLGYILDGELHP